MDFCLDPYSCDDVGPHRAAGPAPPLCLQGIVRPAAAYAHSTAGVTLCRAGAMSVGLSPGAELDRGLRALTESQRAREAFEQMLRGGAAAVHHGTGLAGGQPTPGRAEDDEPFAQSPPMTPEEEHEALQAQAWAAAERAEAAAARDRDSLAEDDRRGPRGAAPATPQSTGLPVGLTLIQTSSGAVALESPRSPSDQAGAGSYMQGTAGGGGGMRQPQFGDGGGQQIETRGGTVLLPPPVDYHTEREARLCAERRVAELERRLREQQRAVRAPPLLPPPPTAVACGGPAAAGGLRRPAARVQRRLCLWWQLPPPTPERPPQSPASAHWSAVRSRVGAGALGGAASTGGSSSYGQPPPLPAPSIGGRGGGGSSSSPSASPAHSFGGAVRSMQAASRFRAGLHERRGEQEVVELMAVSQPARAAPPRPAQLTLTPPAPTDTSASLRWAPVGWGRSSRRTPRSTGGCWPAATTTGWTRGRGSWRGRTACRWAARSCQHLRDRGGEGACRCRPPTRRRRG